MTEAMAGALSPSLVDVAERCMEQLALHLTPRLLLVSAQSPAQQPAEQVDIAFREELLDVAMRALAERVRRIDRLAVLPPLAGAIVAVDRERGLSLRLSVRQQMEEGGRPRVLTASMIGWRVYHSVPLDTE